MLPVVRTLFMFAVSVFCFSGSGMAQNGRHLDYRNTSYFWREPDSWPDKMEWLSVSGSKKAKLVHGRWAVAQNNPGEAADSAEPFSGLLFETVSFGDLTGDGREEAVVVLRFETGGTQYWHYVYIYSVESGHTRLLGYFRTGDRAAFGLYRVYVKGGNLVTELFDPEKRMGDCCSSGFVRTKYHWGGGKFSQVGTVEFGTPRERSHLPVSVFGVHQPQQ
jgi:hypothetical protein